jgi:transmembrane sensor
MKRNAPMHGATGLDHDSSAIQHTAAEWKTRTDAGLSPCEEKDLAAWLEADPRHRAALARFDLVWDKFDRPHRAGAADQLMEELTIRANRRRRRHATAAILGLVAVLGAGSIWRFTNRPDAVLLNEASAPASIATNAILLMPARQTLPDGSVVELKAGAGISVDFSSSVRRVTLRGGEAHFQVTKDAARPFVVEAGGLEARAVGTAFSVNLQSTAVEVLVTEGRVAVDPPVAAKPVSAHSSSLLAAEPFAILGVGRSIVVDLAQSSATPPRISIVQADEIAERLAWRTPRVEFTRTSLAEAVAMLNGYSAGRRSEGGRSVQFIIGDAALSDVRVSGLFRVDQADAFVGLLRNGFGIEAEARGDSEIVLRKASSAQKP